MAKAEEIKVKIENLIDKANTTTGKSDTTLTEGVYSLIAGYGQGGGGGSGGCIIEVDTLPTEGDENALYKMGERYYQYDNKFKDILFVYGGQAQSLVEIIVALGGVVKLYYVKTRPTENIEISDDTIDGGAIMAIYYVEDEDDILVYGDFEDDGTNEWQSIKAVYGDSYGGTITNASQATTENTVYTLVNIGWTEYRVAPNGALYITDNGTFDVTEHSSVTVTVPNEAVCGVWKFNDNGITYDPLVDVSQDINFTAAIGDNNINCTKIHFQSTGFMSDPYYLYYVFPKDDTSYYEMVWDCNKGWLYDSAKIVNFGAEPQIVTSEFKEWLVRNATRIDDEGSISTYQLYGKWKFKDELTSPTADIVQEVSFTSNTYSYTKMEIYNISSGVGIDYYAENDDFIEAYAPDRTPKWYTNYQEIDYGKTPQNVSKEYFEYVTANAEIVGVSALPIDVATESKMNELLATADVGSVYKYTGETTDTYENGGLYIVEAVTE